MQDEETHNFRYLALQTLTVSGAPNLPEVFGAPRKNYKRYKNEIFTQCSQRLHVFMIKILNAHHIPEQRYDPTGRTF